VHAVTQNVYRIAPHIDLVSRTENAIGALDKVQTAQARMQVSIIAYLTQPLR